jgi:antitoxin FitA
MATLTIRDLDDALKQSLRIRAASRNRSMEEEARQILRAALVAAPAPASDLATRIRSRFANLGDVQLSLPVREMVRVPPDFSDASKVLKAPKAPKAPKARKTIQPSIKKRPATTTRTKARAAR